MNFDFSAQRTRVIDDASDYFDSDNKWLNKQQRTKLEKLRSQIDAKKKDQKAKMTIDFAGRRVLNETKENDDRLLVPFRRFSIDFFLFVVAVMTKLVLFMKMINMNYKVIEQLNNNFRRGMTMMMMI